MSNKNRNFSCILYGNTENLTNFINSAEYVPRQYAYIVHDKDLLDNGETKKTHIHLILCYANARSIDNIEKGLKDFMSRGEEKTQNVFIESCRDIKACFEYLTHKNNINKYQYSDSDVICSSVEYFQHVSSTNDYINMILDYVEKQENRYITYTELLRHFGNLIAFTRVNWLQVLKEHNDNLNLYGSYQNALSENEELKRHNKQLQSSVLDYVFNESEKKEK